jgi:tRNA1(Val) A37 N6-methylase TrmN6
VTLAVDAHPRDFAAAGLGLGCTRRVLMNPPFNDPRRRTVSPHPRRRLAHAAPVGGLAVWIKVAARLLAAKGVLTLIWRADDLAQVLAALGGFGAIVIMPVHPKPGAAAIRLLVRAVKEARTPLQLLPGLTLNDADGKPSVAAEAVLRGGDVLPLARMP